MRAGFLALASILAAQQPATLPPLSERIEVTVVNVDVTVLDTRGNPVTGLNADDFEIKEDGVPQPITNFHVVNGSAKPSTSTDFTGDPERRRSFVVLIDERYQSTIHRRSLAAGHIEQLVANSPDASEWSIVTLRDGPNGLRTALPMTADRTLIHDALDALRRGVSVRDSSTEQPEVDHSRLDPDVPVDCPSGRCVATAFRDSVNAALRMQTSDSFFEAVSRTVRGLGWLPGRKAMLIISGDVPGYLLATAGGDARIEAMLHDWMVREANAANVSLFILDPNGPTAGPSSGAYWLAKLTGGAFMPSNRMEDSVSKFDTATSHYYALGYHTEAADGRFHRLAVTLKKPGRFTLLYRQTFLKLSHEQEFERALATPFGIASLKSTVPFTLSVDDPQAAGANLSIVPLRINVPMGSTQFIHGSSGEVGRLHIYVSVFSSAGRNVSFHHYAETITNADAAKKSELIVSRALRLSKGTYRIFVTIRDELSDDVGVVAKEVRL